jgi:hypothetical protein
MIHILQKVPIFYTKLAIALIIVFAQFIPVIVQPVVTVQDYNISIATPGPAVAHADDGCGNILTGFLCHLEVWGESVVRGVAVAILGLAAKVLWFGAEILTLATDYLVFNAGKTLGDSQVVDGIWTLVRDIANFAFIFVLLYTGIMTIFGKGDYKRTILNVVIAGLLINFSLFFVQAFVQYMDAFAKMFYDMAINSAKEVSQVPENITTLSDAILNPLGLQSIFTLTDAIFEDQEGLTPVISITVFGVIFFVVTAFVFFMAAFLLLIRFVVLFIILVASPLIFVSLIIPGMESARKKLLGSLLSYGLMAPIFFGLTFIAISFTNRASIAGTNSLAAVDDQQALAETFASIDQGAGNFGLMFLFIMTTVLMIFALIASKKTASASPAFVGKGINKFQAKTSNIMFRTGRKTAQVTGGVAGRGVAVGAGAVGRRTFGKLGNYYSGDSEKARQLRDTATGKGADKGVRGWAKRKGAAAQLALGGAAANSTFDMRNSETVQTLNQKAGMNMGAGKDLTYGSVVEKGKQKAKDIKENIDAEHQKEVALAEAQKRDLTQEREQAESAYKETKDDAHAAVMRGGTDDEKRVVNTYERAREAVERNEKEVQKLESEEAALKFKAKEAKQSGLDDEAKRLREEAKDVRDNITQYKSTIKYHKGEQKKITTQYSKALASNGHTQFAETRDKKAKERLAERKLQQIKGVDDKAAKEKAYKKIIADRSGDYNIPDELKGLNFEDLSREEQNLVKKVDQIHNVSKGMQRAGDNVERYEAQARVVHNTNRSKWNIPGKLGFDLGNKQRSVVESELRQAAERAKKGAQSSEDRK